MNVSRPFRRSMVLHRVLQRSLSTKDSTSAPFGVPSDKASPLDASSGKSSESIVDDIVATATLEASKNAERLAKQKEIVDHIFSVDRSGLVGGGQPTHKLQLDPNYVPETPTEDVLRKMILTHGPISVKEFMQVALTHPLFGYYMREDVFGTQGDFTTSPEISQMFGELLGVWCVAAFEELGRPSKLRVVELGPGRGTLMKDMIRAFQQFPAMKEAISNGGISMVDASVALGSIQQKTIGAQGYDDTSRKAVVDLGAGANATVEWFSSYTDAAAAHDQNEDEAIIIVAQEFFDALPVEQYQLTERGWCERLVDINTPFQVIKPEDPNNPEQASNADATSKLSNVEQGNAGESQDNPTSTDNAKSDESKARVEDMLKQAPFRFVLSPIPTPLGPINGSPEGSGAEDAAGDIPIGECVEVGEGAAAVMKEISASLHKKSGGVLIVDYGSDTFVRESLRGIKRHKFVHPLKEPGMIDLSVDVDFPSLRRTVESCNTQNRESNRTIVVGGPMEQGEFLLRMGIQTRGQMLLDAAKSEEEAKRIVDGFNRLITPGDDGMGSIYKVLACITGPKDNPPANVPAFEAIEYPDSPPQ